MIGGWSDRRGFGGDRATWLILEQSRQSRRLTTRKEPCCRERPRRRPAQATRVDRTRGIRLRARASGAHVHPRRDAASVPAAGRFRAIGGRRSRRPSPSYPSAPEAPEPPAVARSRAAGCELPTGPRPISGRRPLRRTSAGSRIRNRGEGSRARSPGSREAGRRQAPAPVFGPREPNRRRLSHPKPNRRRLNHRRPNHPSSSPDHRPSSTTAGTAAPGSAAADPSRSGNLAGPDPAVDLAGPDVHARVPRRTARDPPRRTPTGSGPTSSFPPAASHRRGAGERRCTGRRSV